MMYIGYLARVYISRLSSSDDDGSWIIEGLAIYIHSNILSLMLAWKREGFHPEHDFYETSRDGSIIDWSSMHGTPAEEYLFPHTASVYEMLDMELNQALVSFLFIKKYLRHFPEYIPTCVGLSKKIKRIFENLEIQNAILKIRVKSEFFSSLLSVLHIFQKERRAQ